MYTNRLVEKKQIQSTTEELWLFLYFVVVWILGITFDILLVCKYFSLNHDRENRI